MPQSPATRGYRVINAFGTLSFTNPVGIASIPGETNRIFVIEQVGRIIQVTNLHNSPSRSLFMDISARVLSTGNEEGLLGLAFHPGFATNRNFYVFYSVITTTTNPPPVNTINTGRHNRLSRFQTLGGNPDAGDSASEVPLLTQK